MIVRALLVSLLIGTLPACRDHVDPFAANARPDLGDAEVRRLTRSIGNDRAPRWSSDGRTLVYAAEGFEPFQKSRGVLIRIGRDGKEPARPAVPALQSPEGTRRWFVSPALSPDGERLAFAEMTGVLRESPCRGTRICEPADANALPFPRLNAIRLWARRVGDRGAITDEDTLRVTIPGLRFDTTAGLETCTGCEGLYRVDYFAFHRRFDTEEAWFFRPSWSPDGQELAFSDGRRIWIWTPGTGERRRVPGTENGVWPAWSPDGDRIAFTRLDQVSTPPRRCAYTVLGTPVCEAEGRIYEPGRPTLTVISLTGEEPIEVGSGVEPAWDPAGTALVFRYDGRLWRKALGGTVQAESIPGTKGAREPALSPDGEWLAFSKLDEEEAQYDIWVMALESGR